MSCHDLDLLLSLVIQGCDEETPFGVHALAGILDLLRDLAVSSEFHKTHYNHLSVSQSVNVECSAVRGRKSERYVYGTLTTDRINEIKREDMRSKTRE